MPKAIPEKKEISTLLWHFSDDVNTLLIDKFGGKLLFNKLQEILSEIDELQFTYSDKLDEMYGEET